MDLSLEDLNTNQLNNKKNSFSIKKESNDYDFAIYGTN